MLLGLLLAQPVHVRVRAEPNPTTWMASRHARHSSENACGRGSAHDSCQSARARLLGGEQPADYAPGCLRPGAGSARAGPWGLRDGRTLTAELLDGGPLFRLLPRLRELLVSGPHGL